MKILISGSTGLVGTALVDSFHRQNHQIARLVRPATKSKLRESPPALESDVGWDPATGALDHAAAEGAEAVVHLAGASIASGRWTNARKRILRQSRVEATHGLVDALAKLRQPPRTFIAASAIGYYGDRGDEELIESSTPGRGFLADLTRNWEQESMRATAFGARTVCLRFGIILAKNGGALPQMALPFRLGVGGRVGSGKQWMSWVTLADIVEIVNHAIVTHTLTGPVNTVAPRPVRNVDFAKALGRALHRPALLPTPAFALRLALGSMADELLLASQRVLPQKLTETAYRFRHPELTAALEYVWRVA